MGGRTRSSLFSPSSLGGSSHSSLSFREVGIWERLADFTSHHPTNIVFYRWRTGLGLEFHGPVDCRITRAKSPRVGRQIQGQRAQGRSVRCAIWQERPERQAAGASHALPHRADRTLLVRCLSFGQYQVPCKQASTCYVRDQTDRDWSRFNDKMKSRFHHHTHGGLVS